MVRPRSLVAAATLLPLFAGCSGTPSAPVTPGTPADKVTGEVSVQACPPAYSFLPGDAVDRCSTQVMDAVTERLFRVDTATGSVEKDLAESVDTSDSQTFTVHLAKGRTFSDGTEVRARNFVSAWSWAAYGPHSMAGQSYFAPIEGADRMICATDEKCPLEGRPTSLSGLKVLDDHTFTIRTTKPLTDLQSRLSHPVFAPLPDAFFAEEDTKPQSRKLPVGSGPFKLVANNNAEIRLERFDEYAGRWPAQVRRATLRLYNGNKPEREHDRAYDDLVANRLDVSTVIPTDYLIDDEWRKDLAGRSATLNTQLPESLTFAMQDRQLADPRVRQAISMALDRETIARQVFNGTRHAATSWVSPIVPDYPRNGCGRTCGYDPVAARDLLTESGGYTGEFAITVNNDGGNKQWADVVCNQLKNVLNLDCQVKVLNSESEVLAKFGDRRLTGLVQQEWGAGHLSPEPYLSRFGSRARMNLGAYSDTQFDTQLATAVAATSQADANKAYAAAETVLAQNPPSVPLWFATTPAGWSNRVTGVQVNQLGVVDLSALRMA